MTADRRAALVEKVARAMCVAEDIDPDMIVDNHTPTCPAPVWRIFTRQATAAIDLIRAEVLEGLHRRTPDHS